MASPDCQVDLSCVPFPVAYPLHFARLEALGTTDRRNNAIFACYQALRLTALLLLADYVNPDEEDVEPSLTTHIRGLTLPHWQDWSHLADAMAGFWTDPARLERAMFLDLAKAWRLVSRPKVRGSGSLPRDAALDEMAAGFPGLGGRRYAGCANEAIWAERNNAAHREGTISTDGVAAEAGRLPALLDLTEAIVSRLFGEGRFALLRAVRVPGMPLQVIRLQGPHPELKFLTEPPDRGWADDLAPTDVVAVAGDRSIPIYPMMVPAHDDAAQPLFGLEDPVAMIDQVSERKLVLLGVRKAVALPDRHLHLAAALGALRRKNVDVLLTRREIKPWTVDSWSRHSAALTLDELTGRKYFPLFYLERPDVDGAIRRLERTPGGALLLLGEAGSGKSSLIARLVAHRIGANQDTGVATEIAARADAGDIVAFLSGHPDYCSHGDARPGTLLVEALGRKLGIVPGAFGSTADLLLHLASLRGHDLDQGRLTWLLLDGLNEAERFADLVQEVDTLLPHLAALPHVRLVVAMRSGAFHALVGRAETLLQGGGHPVFANRHYLLSFRDGEQEHPWLTVRPFRRQTEGPAAYALRQSALPGRASPLNWTQLDGATQELLLRPLNLHLFHEVWAGRDKAPRGLTEGALLDAYLRALGGEAEYATAGLGRWLDRLAASMLARRSAVLPMTEAESWREEWLRANHFESLSRAAKLDPVEELVGATVLLRPVNDGASAGQERQGYSFTQQKLAERLLLRALDSTLGQSRVPDVTTWQQWLGQVQANPPFPELVGALGEWTVRLVQAGESETLAELLNVEDDAVRFALLQQAIGATTHAAPEVASQVLTQLSERAVEHRDARDRWFHTVWRIADRLAVQSQVRPMQRVWIALWYFAERQADPDSAEAQRDLSVSCNKLGDLALRLNDGAAANTWFEKALAIRERLAQADPDSAEAQRDLSVSCDKLGDLALRLNDGAAANTWFEKALAIRERLAQADPDSAEAQRDLMRSLAQLGYALFAIGDVDQARKLLSAARTIAVQRITIDPADAGLPLLLDWIDKLLNGGASS